MIYGLPSQRHLAARWPVEAPPGRTPTGPTSRALLGLDRFGAATGVGKRPFDDPVRWRASPLPDLV